MTIPKVYLGFEDVDKPRQMSLLNYPDCALFEEYTEHGRVRQTLHLKVIDYGSRK